MKAPNLFNFWSELCEDDVKVLNDPPIDFVEFSDNVLSFFPSGCTTPNMNYVISFGFPSYPYFFSKTVWITESFLWKLTTSTI